MSDLSPALRPAVLVVDDEPMVLITLKVILEREQCAVETCGDPLQALELVKSRDFSVVVSDYKMPGMRGLELLQECRRWRPRCARILLTAQLDLETVMGAIAVGDISRYVAKPWLREELVAAVRDGVQRHELICRNEALQQEADRLTALLAAAHLELEARGAQPASRRSLSG